VVKLLLSLPLELAYYEKKAQKKAKKKQTSEVINKIIPYRNPFSTTVVCHPWKVDSRTTSRHQLIIVVISNISPVTKRASVPV